MPDSALGLFTDLYEFTMAQSYLEHGMTGEAVFDLHVRELPAGRGYLVAAGLATLLERLKRYRFTEEDLAYLGEQGLSDELLDHLSGLSFEGTVTAIPEGRLVFPREPILQIRAPLPTAQLVETLVLNTIHVETLVATKAARCLDAAGGVPDGGPDEGPEGAQPPRLVDFGARRAHGPDAARAAARSAYLAGFAGTSLVSLAHELDVPCLGTMAHSYVQAFDDEGQALEAFASSFPQGTTLLIDTYDTLEGARKAVAVAGELAEQGGHLGGVRIDSGDLDALSREVRALLDQEGLEQIDVFVSGGLDEHAIAALVQAGAPIDGFGVGTSLVVSEDHPSLDISYKLCEYEGEPVMKTSPDKQTLPGAKQVHRRTDEHGQLAGDTIAVEGEEAEGEPLLQPARLVDPARALQDARSRFLDEIARLAAEHRSLREPETYPVARSEGLDALVEQALARVGQG